MGAIRKRKKIVYYDVCPEVFIWCRRDARHTWNSLPKSIRYQIMGVEEGYIKKLTFLQLQRIARVYGVFTHHLIEKEVPSDWEHYVVPIPFLGERE